MKWLLSDNELDNSWLGLGDTSKILLPENKLLAPINEKIYEENPGLWETECLIDPQYFAYFSYWALGITLPPYQMAIINNLWKHRFPMFVGSRGSGKSTCIAIYSLLRAILIPEQKIVLTAPSFRQAKAVMEYAVAFWEKAPIMRSMCDRKSGFTGGLDRWTLRINDSLITAVPLGTDGSRIRGLRSNVTIVDEVKDVPGKIIEEVIFGFGAVAQNPIEKLKAAARKQTLEEEGITIEKEVTSSEMNQSIMTGTASYYFEEYYSYWKKYKAIIECKGDYQKLKDQGIKFDDRYLSWEDFCIIRMPYPCLPEGLMDDATIARARTNMSEALYMKEYEAVFIEDSDGFFKRTLIEGCVASDKNIAANKIPEEFCDAPFDPTNFGSDNFEYVLGIDPAFKEDNFAIVLLECRHDHARVRYCWTTNEENFVDRKQSGTTQEDNYYAFVSRHIRELMKTFNIIGIAIDAQGGGMSLMEHLASSAYLQAGEKPLYPVIDPGKRKETDSMDGDHLLYSVQFANATWVSQSNHGLLADMEKKRLLFPRFDAATVELSIAEDKIKASRIAKEYGVSASKVRLYDSLEDTAQNIEELKDELTSIQYTRTGAGIGGREKWSVPEIRIDENTKASGKKDRYCALLMANWLANQYRLNASKPTDEYLTGSLIKDGISKRPDADAPGYSEGSGYGDAFRFFGAVKK